MLNKDRHRFLMAQILKDLYSEVEIASLLGFKGGTCTYFFHGLPRFSVDLDFDFLGGKQELEPLRQKVEDILKKYGKIKISREKRFTLFFLLSYGTEDVNIKIEISKRKSPAEFEMKDLLGISVLAMKKEDLFSSKLCAFTLRNELANRDAFDIWFFANSGTPINEKVVEFWTKQNTKEQLLACIKKLKPLKSNQLLHGLGELVEDEKQKAWIQKKMKDEIIFLLKNYLSLLK